MKATYATPCRILVSLAVLLTSSVACASVITVNGTEITLLSSPNLSVQSSGSRVEKSQVSTGILEQFDPSLGVLTGATGTLTLVGPRTLTRGGANGTAGFGYQWTLGGNVLGPSLGVTNPATSVNLITAVGSLALSSSASNLNNFVGPGNIAQNSIRTYVSAQRSATSGITTGTVSNTVLANESITYTYSTHSNASFTSPSDTNLLTINLGLLANGASANQTFNIFDLGGLGLTGFNASFVSGSGNDVFSVTGDTSIEAGGFESFSANFAGLSPGALTSYSGTYRLTFTDDVTGLAKYASESVRSNYIDLTMMASVAPAVSAVPEPTSLVSFAGLGAMGLVMAWRRRKRAA